jgi:hypothetical protein
VGRTSEEAIAVSSQRKDPDLAPDPLAAEVKPRPDTPSRAIYFTGQLGESSKTGNVRLYIDPEFRSWLEIAERDIVHREKLDDRFTSGGSMLWVKRSAGVGQGQLSAREMQQELLKGEIVRRYLPDAVTDEQIAGGFISTLVCATIAITCWLCITPSCEEITHPLFCEILDEVAR